ncbi:MAG: sugar ABC transporter permease [Acidobacteria bacterium]|nr:sugar ABC transporter permease [Acidobacteriota bacterium]
MKNKLSGLVDGSSLRAFAMIAVLAVIWGYFHWATGQTFLKPQNLSNLMTQMSVTGIIAVGMLMLIVSANIDLSVGSVLGLAGGIAAFTLTNLGYPIPVAIGLALLAGIAIGVFQGVLVAKAGIPAFIVTLGGLLAWRGAVKWQLGGNTVPIADDTFKMIGQGNIPAWVGWVLAGIAVAFVIAMAIRSQRAIKEYGLGEGSLAAALLKSLVPIGAILIFIWVMNSYQGVPIPVLIFVTVALAGSFLMSSTTFGRYLYAIGGNADAARLSGINNSRNVIAVYGILGALTGIAALIYTARVGSAAPSAGTLKELDAIAACVIGGASLMGGRGTVFGACLGALLMASLDNGMSLLNVRDFMQDIIKGSILVAAVGLDMMGRKQG